MLIYVHDNILNHKGIICHQVNCQGKFGSGLAKQIANKYPEVKYAYITYFNKYIEDKESLLGSVQYCDCTDGNVVLNLFSQFDYGRENEQYTDYNAFKQCLKIINSRITNDYFSDKTPMPIAFPYKIGCGTGGGDWSMIENILDIFFKNKKVYIYKRKGD